MPAPAIEGMQRVVLIGFSATGKSAVAVALAARLGWQAIDTDTLIEQRAGRSIAAIFADDGEHAFRQLEREAVESAAGASAAVVATGGGAWLDEDSRRQLAAGGFVVALEARLETIMARNAQAQPDRGATRPLLDAADPAGRIQTLKAARQPFYALADATVHTDVTTVDGVVETIVQAIQRDGERVMASRSRLHALAEGPGVPAPSLPWFGDDVACVVRAGASVYPVYCGWGLLERVPAILDTIGLGGRLFLISDAALRDRYADPLAARLEAAGREVFVDVVPGGEASKSLAQLERLYEALAGWRAERGDVVLALGGGVITDLAGTAAATYLRGMALVHLPTTLLGMVDASIGGKVAVDLPAGKNLVGAFYQPRAVIADVATLGSLPPRELRAGYAEVIKHAFIRDPAMLEELERDADLLLAPSADGEAQARMVRLIGRNMAIKAAVVSADERESDLRMVLNYGHTIGHAIEAVAGYGVYLHGEAVAIGLIGAALIAARLGLLAEAEVERHGQLLERFGLPTRVDPSRPLEPEAVLGAIQHDKKVVGGRARWVLLESPGSPLVRDAPEALVWEVVGQLVGG